MIAMDDLPAYQVVSIQAGEAEQEILVALLSELGYEGFVQEDNLLTAYLPASLYDEPALQEVLGQVGNLLYEVRTEPWQNWNAQWEADYPSVALDDFVLIYPSFRAPVAGFEHALQITPKMSFGTGHHHTTRLMIQQMRSLDFTGKRVLDMGCGTGVLGILAARLGAQSVHLIDIEPWAAENAAENLLLNGVDGQVFLGDVSAIPHDAEYDILLANINRNILQADLSTYAKHLPKGGLILVSGFFDFDAPAILDSLAVAGFEEPFSLLENGWCSIKAFCTN